MLREGISGDWIGTFEGHTGAVWSAKLNSSATRAATGSADSSAKFWNGTTGELLTTFDHKKPVRTVDFKPSGADMPVCLATGGYEAIVRLFDLTRFDAEPTVMSAPGKTSRIKKLLWAPDGRTLYMGTEDGTLRLLDASSGKVVRELNGLTVSDPSKNGVMDLELSRDEKILTVACGQSISFIDLQSHEILKSYNLNADVETASLHPSHQRTFIAGGFDVYVRIYDFETGAELAEKKGHHGKVHCLRFSPTGSTFSSGADDATIRLWRYDDSFPNTSSSIPQVKQNTYLAPHQNHQQHQMLQHQGGGGAVSFLSGVGAVM